MAAIQGEGKGSRLVFPVILSKCDIFCDLLSQCHRHCGRHWPAGREFSCASSVQVCPINNISHYRSSKLGGGKPPLSIRAIRTCAAHVRSMATACAQVLAAAIADRVLVAAAAARSLYWRPSGGNITSVDAPVVEADGGECVCITSLPSLVCVHHWRWRGKASSSPYRACPTGRISPPA